MPTVRPVRVVESVVATPSIKHWMKAAFKPTVMTPPLAKGLPLMQRPVRLLGEEVQPVMPPAMELV